MKNSNLNNEYLDDEIDLIGLLRTIYSSKKLIILITLASALLAFIYLAQKEAEYQSTVILEVGSYRLLDGEKKLIEPVSSLIKKLRINEISQQLVKLDLNSIEDYFLEINYISPSIEFNENTLNEAIRFTEEDHIKILAKIENSNSKKIKLLNQEIKFNENVSLNNLRYQELEALKAINRIDVEIDLTEIKINFLKKIILTDDNNLVIEDQLMSLKVELDNFIRKKDILELEVESIRRGVLKSERLFILHQEKNNLELLVNLANTSLIMTQPIRDIVTSEIKQNQLLIILLSAILGFIFSVLIVVIRQVFLKEQN